MLRKTKKRNITPKKANTITDVEKPLKVRPKSRNLVIEAGKMSQIDLSNQSPVKVDKSMSNLETTPYFKKEKIEEQSVN